VEELLVLVQVVQRPRDSDDLRLRIGLILSITSFYGYHQESNLGFCFMQLFHHCVCSQLLELLLNEIFRVFLEVHPVPDVLEIQKL
jgi:chloramphenicol O-acetyltransferase